MPPTEKPRNSVHWERVVNLVGALAGLLASLAALISLVRGDLYLVRPIALGLAISLIGVGTAQTNCGSHALKELGVRKAARRYGRLCVAVGIAQIIVALALPVEAIAIVGLAATGLLLWQGLRQRFVKRVGRRPLRARVLTGSLVPAGVTLLALAYGCLAVAAITSKPHSGAPKGGEKGERRSSSGAASGQDGADPEAELRPFTYAELCTSLPNPLEIGHGLGELFARDGAVKAGCGTPAFRVADTGLWVASGVCLGEPRSVAVSSRAGSRPGTMVYGEAAEFVLAAARDGTLAGVEAAEPEGGDVVLVETLAGTYGFARSTRSATPGNEDARRCNEVGGTAEPFAQLAPPLVLLWRDLVRRSASWFWPTPDSSEEGESVSFISTGEVVAGFCTSDDYCVLDDDVEPAAYSGPAFIALHELEQFMPPPLESDLGTA